MAACLGGLGGLWLSSSLREPFSIFYFGASFIFLSGRASLVSRGVFGLWVWFNSSFRGN